MTTSSDINNTNDSALREQRQALLLELSFLAGSHH
jgi:hypothetical protein